MSEYEVKAYKIYWEDEPDIFYIGSTKQRSLATRMSTHRSEARGFRKQSKFYNFMRGKGLNFKYVLLGSCMVHNMDEQRMFEQTYIDSLKPSLNVRDSCTTVGKQAEYYRNYKQTDAYKLKKAEYDQRLACICGGSHGKAPSDLNKHLQTRKHKRYMSEGD